MAFHRAMWLAISFGLCCVGCDRRSGSIPSETGHTAEKKMNIPREKLKCQVLYYLRPRSLSEEGTKLLSDLLNEITPENGYAQVQWPKDRDRKPDPEITIYFYRFEPASENAVVWVDIWTYLGGAIAFSGEPRFTVGKEKVNEIDSIIKKHSVPE